MRSQPLTPWDALPRRAWTTLFSEALKRIYGAEYEGLYCDEVLALERERYEDRRYRLLGRPEPRKWADLRTSLGLRLGKHPIEAPCYATSPLFVLLPRDASL